MAIRITKMRIKKDVTKVIITAFGTVLLLSPLLLVLLLLLLFPGAFLTHTWAPADKVENPEGHDTHRWLPRVFV